VSTRLRKPTGVPNWPLILLEGPAQVGKSYQAAQFTGSEKVGQSYWLDLGEGAADEYGAVPGAEYLIVQHDGTWRDILAGLIEVRDLALSSKDENPPVLVVDSMSNLWDMLKSWVNNRARSSKYNKRVLETDPDAEIKAAPNLWNDAADRHAQFINALTSFPGIVIMTAKGKETMAVDSEGRPVPNAKDYSVEGHKSLPFAANVHVRLSREDPPLVVSFRSATAGLRPGVDKPKRYPDFTIEDLVFNEMGLGKAQTRDVAELVSDEKALADEVRRELGVFIRDNKLSYKPISEAFHRDCGETLEDTRDAQAVRNLLDTLKMDQQAAQEAS
jgi:hypothetical protein